MLLRTRSEGLASLSITLSRFSTAGRLIGVESERVDGSTALQAGVWSPIPP